MASAYTKEVDKVLTSKNGVMLDVWLYLPSDPGPYPVVIAGHGMTVTKDAALDAFGQRWATNAGYASAIFDYRGFGASDGEPRNVVCLRDQLEDFKSVLAWIRDRPSQFRFDKIVVMGSAMGALSVAELIVSDDTLAGGMVHSPLLDGYATLSAGTPNHRLLFWAVVDSLKGKLGLSPTYIKAIGKPDEFAFLNTPSCHKGFVAMYERAHRPFSEMPNLIAPRVAFEVMSAHPGLRLKDAHSPLLLVMPEEDDMIPSAVTHSVAENAGSKVELVVAIGGHFDVMEGGKGFDTNMGAQIKFLRRLL